MRVGCRGGKVVIHGMLENVSFKGLLLDWDASLPGQTPCQLFLHVIVEEVGHTIEAQGLVVRNEPFGVAVQFMELVGHENAQWDSNGA